MGAGHEQAIVADPRLHATTLGTGVHGDMFADLAILADGQRRRLTLVLQILRRMADGGEGENTRPLAHLGDAGHGNVGHQFDTLAQFHVGTDHAKRADNGGISDARLGINDSGGMDIGHQSSRIMAA